MPPRPSLLEIFLVALRLGCMSFGGPVAHLAFFRQEYVVKRRWLDETHYADLVALCQFLPGLLLVAGVLPFWQALRHQPGAQAALRGTNAAVVGLLLAALIVPVMATGLTGRGSLVLAAAGFAALQFTPAPAWTVVGAAATLGAFLL